MRITLSHITAIPLPEAQYGSKVAGLRAEGKAHDNPDGSVTFTLDIPKQWMMVPEGTLFDVVLTYYPSNQSEPDPYSPYDDPRSTARIPLPTVRDPEPDQPTYRYSISAVDKPWQDTTLTVEGYHILPPEYRRWIRQPGVRHSIRGRPGYRKDYGTPCFLPCCSVDGQLLASLYGFSQ